MRRSARQRALALVCIVLAGAAWIGPAHAFNYASALARAATASVQSDANSFDAPIFKACSVSRVVGGTCTAAIFDNATTNQTFTVILQADASGAVNNFHLDSATNSAGVGASSTGSAKNVGQSSTLTMVTNTPCAVFGCTDTTEWIYTGTTTNQLDYREEHITWNVTFT